MAGLRFFIVILISAITTNEYRSFKNYPLNLFKII